LLAAVDVEEAKRDANAQGGSVVDGADEFGDIAVLQKC
jgi:predicted enzyme related to lactoylglutathione lyase